VGISCGGKRTPRQGMAVLIGNADAGIITSGCMSPTLDRPIAMAYMPIEQAEAGTAVEIDAGRARIAGEVVALPFYKAAK
jgi:glycine cleavage system T protein (aminomethyltransferase)